MACLSLARAQPPAGDYAGAGRRAAGYRRIALVLARALPRRAAELVFTEIHRAAFGGWADSLIRLPLTRCS